MNRFWRKLVFQETTHTNGLDCATSKPKINFTRRFLRDDVLVFPPDEQMPRLLAAAMTFHHEQDCLRHCPLWTVQPIWFWAWGRFSKLCFAKTIQIWPNCFITLKIAKMQKPWFHCPAACVWVCWSGKILFWNVPPSCVVLVQFACAACFDLHVICLIVLETLNVCCFIYELFVVCACGLWALHAMSAWSVTSWKFRQLGPCTTILWRAWLGETCTSESKLRVQEFFQASLR